MLLRWNGWEAKGVTITSLHLEDTEKQTMNQTAITVQTYCCVSIVSVCRNIFNKVNYAVSIVCEWTIKTTEKLK